MKKVIIGTVLLLTTTLSAFSQTKNITVAGRVIEDDTKEPAVQATVQLLSLPDSAFAAGIATTAQGYFTLPKVQAGKYVLKVSYIGFQPTVLPLQLSAQNPNKNGKVSIVLFSFFIFISSYNCFSFNGIS